MYIGTTVQLREHNIHVSCCLFSHIQLKIINKKKKKWNIDAPLCKLFDELMFFTQNNQRSTSHLTRSQDQLAVYKDENNDKWFEKQRKMIANHAINEKKRSS